jgi:signal transduction histidine kinase
MGAGEAVADTAGVAAAARTRRPSPPGEGEAILWQGRPQMLSRKLWELAGFLTLLALLTWLAIELIRPHLSGSGFAGNPNAGSLPLILAMVAGMIAIIALPVWLRSSARARAVYVLTNRRALVLLGRQVIGEAMLFGADMWAGETEVRFDAAHMYLSWRLKDEGADYLRFEQIREGLAVAALAEEHGARWQNRPDSPADGADSESKAA